MCFSTNKKELAQSSFPPQKVYAGTQKKIFLSQKDRSRKKERPPKIPVFFLLFLNVIQKHCPRFEFVKYYKYFSVQRFVDNIFLFLALPRLGDVWKLKVFARDEL